MGAMHRDDEANWEIWHASMESARADVRRLAEEHGAFLERMRIRQLLHETHLRAIQETSDIREIYRLEALFQAIDSGAESLTPAPLESTERLVRKGPF
jgi:hypothetical protein